MHTCIIKGIVCLKNMVICNNCLFRVCKNNYVINKITDTNDNRLLHLKARFAKDDELEIKPWNKNGKHIIVIPPSYWLCKNLGWNPTESITRYN